MSIFNLKKKTAGKFIKNQLNKADTGNKIKTSRILKVGILADLGLFQTYDFTKRLSADLGLEKNQLSVFLFDMSAQGSSIDNYTIGNESSFGLFGKIANEDLAKFVNTDFDLLINYCESDLLYDQVIMIRSKAKLKAGFEADQHFFNDISIKIPENKIDTFNTELVKYLEILKLIN